MSQFYVGSTGRDRSVGKDYESRQQGILGAIIEAGYYDSLLSFLREDSPRPLA